MSDQLSVVLIEGAPRHYAWGSPTVIPHLLGLPPDGRPVAEMWFGAHVDDPSPVAGERRTLAELIDADPAAVLGADTVDRFGPRLPFLLKVLAADKPLSLQVHPDQAQARAGFAAEDARGIPRDAPHRNYRDENHKPELLCALTPFDALCGFRPVERTLAVLAVFALPELDPVAAALRGPEPLQAAFTGLLTMSDPAPLAHRVAARSAELHDDPVAGATARAVTLAASEFAGDVGVALALLLNPVRLEPGEAIFLAAGNVHAYLRGLGVEVMANSDNVLRCGLTPKHIDVPELLAITDFAPLDEPRYPGGDWGSCRHFTPPVADFALSLVALEDYRKPGRDHGSCATGNAGQPYVVLCADGWAEVTVEGRTVRLGPGQAAFVPARDLVFTIAGNGTVFTATTGARQI